MGTFTISASGFSTLPASPPAGWPNGMAWPGAVSPNGTKSWTVSDADWVNVVVWSANANIGVLGGAPTISAVLTSFAQMFVNIIKQTVTQFFTVPPAPPTFT